MIPDTFVDQFNEALRLVNCGRMADALVHARRASTLDPQATDATFLCAFASAELGAVAEAESELDNMRVLMRFRPLSFQQWAVERLHRSLGRAREVQAARTRRREPVLPHARSVPVRAKAAPPAETQPTGATPALPVAMAEPSVDAARHAAHTGVTAQTALTDYRLRLTAQAIERLRGYDTLLALHEVHGVDHYEYQLRTVRRVLREFRGRVLLADEVGLGKTVEACLCLKEYLLRGLVRSVLVIVPAPLRAQWQDELRGKFAIEARLVESADLRDGHDAFAEPGVSLVSLGLARLPAASEALARARFDLVIVDEAHRLKNRKTRSWQLVDRLRARYLFMLSATPIENDLIEIYNVLTLLKPGLFSTEAEFRHVFVNGKSRTPKDPARLRGLLREVMVRNTRALVDAQLPPRFATTLRAEPESAEAELYARVVDAVRVAVRAEKLTLARAGEVLRAIGCAPFAAAEPLERLFGTELAQAASAFAVPGARIAKDVALLDLLARREREKVLLFVGARKSQEHVFDLVKRAGHRAGIFHGSLDRAHKEQAIASFAGDIDVLVASDSGGEGFNLHFARTVVNYDLPWNPMRIEQRIGRVHRIGQTREVFVFNLVSAGTIEEEVLRVLDEKINMFELVVGEIDAILGRLGDDEKEFQDLVLELYARADGAPAARAAFDALAEQVTSARAEYGRVKQLEDAVLGEELGA